ncbi:MAG: S41 family peptidase, partial [Fimbriimonadaceae bacterium]
MAAVLVQDGDVMRMMRHPDIHEDKVVFTFANDLWLGSTEGGIARRLTTHPGAEYLAQFSPDGEHIAFTASYDGNPDVYLIPAEGGEPERVTYQPGTDYMAAWTPDGDIAYTSTFQSALNDTRLYIQDPDGSWPRTTPLYEVADLSFSPDGETVAFNRARSHVFNWRRYRGGTQGVISFYNFEENEYWELPHERENQWFPMWVEDSVYFVSDRDFGTVNLFRSDMQGNNIERLTNFDDADIRWPNTDGETIVWERNGYLETYDLDTGDVSRIDQRVVGDRIHTRPEFMNLAPYISTFSISPSGKRLAVEARGEIFSLPATSGETRNLTDSPGSRERWVQWSPTGENIAYLSDETGEYKIYIEPQMGGDPEMLDTPDEHRIYSFAWSPDAESMVYRTTDGSAYLIDVESEETTFVYRNPRGFQAFTPSFSHDSTWLAYIKNE